MRKSKKQILIVDDEPAWRTILSHLLSKRGYQVKEARSGVEALRTLAKYTPDLIFSDVRMPDMNGFDFLDTVKKLPKFASTPIVFCSAIDDYDAKKVARDLGAAGYLVKPFDEEEIRSVLSKTLS